MNAAMEDEAAIGLDGQTNTDRDRGQRAEVVDRMRENYFKLLDEQVYASRGLDSIKKSNVPRDLDGQPINVRENEMALKEFQRRTTFELGLRNSDRPSHSPKKLTKNAH